MNGGRRYTHAPRRRIVTPFRILLVALLATVVVIGLFGGWRRAERTGAEVATIRPDETVSTLPFAITPKRAEWTTSSRVPYYTKEGERLIVVVLELETMADFPVHTSTLGNELITDIPTAEGTEFLPGFFKRKNIRTYRTIDNHDPGTLSPGLRHEIGYGFTQPLTAPLPDEVTVLLPSLTWREHNGGLGYNWFDPTVAARVVLPIERMAEP